MLKPHSNLRAILSTLRVEYRPPPLLEPDAAFRPCARSSHALRFRPTAFDILALRIRTPATGDPCLYPELPCDYESTAQFELAAWSTAQFEPAAWSTAQFEPAAWSIAQFESARTAA